MQNTTQCQTTKLKSHLRFCRAHLSFDKIAYTQLPKLHKHCTTSAVYNPPSQAV